MRGEIKRVSAALIAAMLALAFGVPRAGATPSREEPQGLHVALGGGHAVARPSDEAPRPRLGVFLVPRTPGPTAGRLAARTPQTRAHHAPHDRLAARPAQARAPPRG